MVTIPDSVSTLELSKLLIYKALKKVEAENGSQQPLETEESRKDESN